jgi:hypothetical protein
MPYSNTECKVRGPFIPRRKIGGFLAHFYKEGRPVGAE